MADTLADLVVNLKANFSDAQSRFDSIMEQMKGFTARSEDGKAALANLSAAFEEVLPGIDAVKNAQAGAKLSADEFIDALDKGIDERFGATSMEEAAAAAKAHEDALKASKDAAAALDDELGVNADGFKSAEEMTRSEARALEEAKEAYRHAGEGAEELAEHTKHAHDESAELLKELLELSGVALTAEGIKELAKESILAYGAEEQLAVSLDLLGAGATGALEKIEELKDLSIQLAVPFEQLSHSARELSAAFGTGEGLTAVLIGAGNVAQATGRSFSTVAGSLERVQLTGAVSARQLMQLGLSWKDLASTMGVSIDEAQAKLKKGGQSAAEDVGTLLDAIQQKYGDAAQRQAETTLGQITQLKNRMEFLMADLGETLAPKLTATFNVVYSGAVILAAGVEVLIDTISSMVTTTVHGLEGLAKIAKDIVTGNFTQAAADSKATITGVANDLATGGRKIVGDSVSGALLLEKAWGDAAVKIKAAFDATDEGGGGKATKPDKMHWVKTLSDDLAVLVAQEHLAEAAKKALIEATAKFNNETGASLNVLEFLQGKALVAAMNLGKLKEALAPTTAISPWFTDPPVTSWNAMAIAEKAAKDGMDAVAASVDHLAADALSKDPYGKLMEGARVLGITTTQELQQMAVKAGEAYDMMKASGIATDRDLSIAALEYAKKATDAAYSVGDITRKEYDKTSKQIKSDLDTLTGATESATKKQVTALTQVNKVIVNDLAKGLEALIFQTGKVGDVFKKLGQDVAGVFLKIITSAIEKTTETWLTNLLVGKAEQSTVDVASVTGQAGIAGAAGFASVMASIPFPANVALAPEVAAAAAAAVEASFGSMAAFDLGGRVPEDMIAKVHGGEHILTDPLTQGLESLVASGGLSGGGGMTMDFRGAVFNGVTQDLVKDVMSKAVRAVRAPLSTNLRF